MADIDPGLAIVLTVLGIVAVMLALGLRQRRAARARMAALREAERIEIELVSQGRMAAVVLAGLMPIVFGAPFAAMALGDAGREHALAFVIALMMLSAVTIVLPAMRPPAWVKVGRLVLEGSSLRLEENGAVQEVTLSEPWTLREGVIPPGQRTEILVRVGQGRVRIVFRYAVLLGAEAYAEGLPVVAPDGVVLGPEARVVHERLRAALRERVDDA
jgi:uncharacterized membrane protein